jgi:hypothetical protein
MKPDMSDRREKPSKGLTNPARMGFGCSAGRFLESLAAFDPRDARSPAGEFGRQLPSAYRRTSLGQT